MEVYFYFLCFFSLNSLNLCFMLSVSTTTLVFDTNQITIISIIAYTILPSDSSFNTYIIDDNANNILIKYIIKTLPL